MVRWFACGLMLLAALAYSSAVVISNGNSPPVHIRTTDNGTFYLPLRSPDPRVARTAHNMAPEQIKITYWAPGQMLISWATGEHKHLGSCLLKFCWIYAIADPVSRLHTYPCDSRLIPGSSFSCVYTELACTRARTCVRTTAAMRTCCMRRSSLCQFFLLSVFL